MIVALDGNGILPREAPSISRSRRLTQYGRLARLDSDGAAGRRPRATMSTQGRCAPYCGSSKDGERLDSVPATAGTGGKSVLRVACACSGNRPSTFTRGIDLLFPHHRTRSLSRGRTKTPFRVWVHVDTCSSRTRSCPSRSAMCIRCGLLRAESRVARAICSCRPLPQALNLLDGRISGGGPAPDRRLSRRLDERRPKRRLRRACERHAGA